MKHPWEGTRSLEPRWQQPTPIQVRVTLLPTPALMRGLKESQLLEEAKRAPSGPASCLSKGPPTGSDVKPTSKPSQGSGSLLQRVFSGY